MHDALLIARREYLVRIRSKAFLFTTILIPLIMAAMFGGSYFASTSMGSARHLVIASSNPALAHAVAQELRTLQKTSRIEVDAPAPPGDRVDLMRRVEARRIDGALWLGPDSATEQNEAIYYSRSAADLGTSGRIQEAVDRATLRTHLAALGVSGAEIQTWMKPAELRTVQLKRGRAANSSSVGSFVGAYLMIFLLYFTVIYYGMNVARSVIEEKTSRIFEVLLSATTPQSLMAGKLLGVGAAGLTQIGIWIAVALAGGTAYAGRYGLTGGVSGGLSALGITPSGIIFFAVYFLLGFLFYSALSAGFGASVSSEQEVQQFSFFIVAPLLVGIIGMNYILANPNAPGVVALSLFPPCTPTVMYLRMAAQQPPAWQVALSIALLIAAVYAMLWIASRIYRVGILMYGKRATLPEMLRWLRYS